MRTNNIVILGIAIILGGIAAFLARGWLLTHSQMSDSSQTIVVASVTLPFGTTLTENNLTEIRWGSRALPDGAFTSKQALLKDGRRAVLATIVRNQPILASNISGPGRPASLSTTIEPGKRAVTVRVDDIRGVAGFIMPNDHVDVVLIRASSTAQHGSYSDLLLQNIKVIAVDQVAAEQKEKPSIAKAVTLEVTPEQAQKVALATEIGTLSLILRQPGEADIVSHDRITEADLITGETTARSVHTTAPAAPPQATAKTAPSSGEHSNAAVYVIRDFGKDGQKYMVPRQRQFAKEAVFQ
jgi:pilus assembly protein CpaB